MRQLGFAIFVVLFSGCLCSVHPILKDTNLTKDLNLSGTWKLGIGQIRGVNDAKSVEGYSFVAKGFSTGGESDYEIKWAGKELHGQIGKIGDDYYVQLRRTELVPEIPPLLHAVPVYTIAKLKLTGENKLELFTIDEELAPGILKSILKENELDHLLYHPSDSLMVKYFVLTGSTDSMQAKFRSSGDRIFTKRMIYMRE